MLHDLGQRTNYQLVSEVRSLVQEHPADVIFTYRLHAAARLGWRDIFESSGFQSPDFATSYKSFAVIGFDLPFNRSFERQAALELDQLGRRLTVSPAIGRQPGLACEIGGKLTIIPPVMDARKPACPARCRRMTSFDRPRAQMVPA